LFAGKVIKKAVMGGAAFLILCAAVFYFFSEWHVFLGVLVGGLMVYGLFLFSLAVFNALSRKAAWSNILVYSYLSFFGKLMVTGLLFFVFSRLGFMDMYWFLVSFLIFFTVFLVLEVILLCRKSGKRL